MEINQELSEHACASCGVVFAITGHYEAQRRKDSANFHCPNGHILVFNNGKSVPDMQVLVDKLTKENEELKKANIALRSQVDQLEAKVASSK